MYRNQPVDTSSPYVQHLKSALECRGYAMSKDAFWREVSGRDPPFPVVFRLSRRLGCPLEPRQFGYASTVELEEELRNLVEWYSVPRGRERDADELDFLMSLVRRSTGAGAPSISPELGPRVEGGGVSDNDGVREALRTTCVDVVLQGLLNNQRVPSGFAKGSSSFVAPVAS
jgi:hypothetical protein